MDARKDARAATAGSILITRLSLRGAAGVVSDGGVRDATGIGALDTALYNLCASRPEPIPFFGELGSVNPMFVLPEAALARGHQIGQGWAASLTVGAGQFCTNPGIAVVIDGADADAFANAAKEALSGTAPQVMLTDGMAEAYRSGAARVGAGNGVRSLVTTTCEARHASPYLFEVLAEDWLENHDLAKKVFGPLGLIIRVRDAAQMEKVSRSFGGQLTTTLQMDDGDIVLARRLLPVLEHMAGRVLANGFPTGVEVADSMVHGGPYPSSTNFGATSVSTLSIRRFLRPVCYQNLPEALLPEDLH